MSRKERREVDEFGNEAEWGKPRPKWVGWTLLPLPRASGPQPETRLNGRLDERATQTRTTSCSSYEDTNCPDSIYFHLNEEFQCDESIKMNLTLLEKLCIHGQICR